MAARSSLPIWFVVDDGQLVFNTGKDTAKVIKAFNLGD